MITIVIHVLCLLRDIYAVLFKVIESITGRPTYFKVGKIFLTTFVSKSENFKDFGMISLVLLFYCNITYYNNNYSKHYPLLTLSASYHFNFFYEYY